MSRTPSSPKSSTALRAHWQTLAPREQQLLSAAAALIALALLWWLALAPALATLRQAEAAALKASPRMGQDEALRALETLVKQRLGATAQLSVVGDRANLTLKNTPAADLAGWLAEARLQARAVPLEARLTRAPGVAAGSTAQWSGSLSLGLPAR